MQKLLAILALSAIVIVTPIFVFAQDSSSLTGTVTDVSGAVIPRVTVTLSNASTGVSFIQTTDKQGSYKFLNLPPNSGYKLVFSHDGFSVSEISDIGLSVGFTRTQDAKLRPGHIETVEVSARNEAVTLDTTDASVGNNIDVQQLNELPIYDRTAGISTLFTQQPGGDSFQGAVTGARIDQTSVTVDAFPGRSFPGWVGFISPMAEFTPKSVEPPQLRSSLVYELRVFVQDPNDELRLGSPATVHLPLTPKASL